MQKAAEYITSKEGERLLGVKRNTFFYYVESGQIAKKEKSATDKGTNLYSYADILKVKENWDRKKKSYLQRWTGKKFLTYQRSLN